MDLNKLKSEDVWLTAFWGFDPESDGSYGFTAEVDQKRFLTAVSGRPLVAIYGAAAKETAAVNRNNFIGLLQIDLATIDGKKRLSAEAWQSRVDRGHENKWLNAFAVKRAWRPVNRVSVAQLFESYDSTQGQYIASYGKMLNQRDKDQLFSMSFVETSVFGEEPVPHEDLSHPMKLDEFCPSKAFKKSFGDRTSSHEDGETYLYLMRLVGGAGALLDRGRSKGEIVIKVGVSNDVSRREDEINAGFPPASKVKWEQWRSAKFDKAAFAEDAEDQLKKRFESSCSPLGGEFFRGNETEFELGYISVATATGDVIKAVR